MGLFSGIIKGALGGFIGSGFNPIGAAIGAVGGAASGRAADKAQDAQNRANEINNQYQQQVYDAQIAQREAEMQAMAEQIAAQQEATRAVTEGQRDAFGLTQQAGEAERDARSRLAKKLEEFGTTKKKVGLAEARRKRGGSAKQSAQKGGTGAPVRAGKVSRGFTTSLASAGANALNQAADLSGMRGELTGYGADASREFDEFGDLALAGAQDRSYAEELRKVANARSQLAGQEGAALNDAAAQRYRIALARARELGYVEPQPYQTINPNSGTLDAVSDIAGLGMLGLGAFGGSGSGSPLASNPYNRTIGFNPGF